MKLAHAYEIHSWNLARQSILPGGSQWPDQEVQAECTEKVHVMQKFKAKGFVITWQLWPVLANSDYVRFVLDMGQSLTK